MESLAVFFIVVIAGWIWYLHNQSRRRLKALAANGIRVQATIVDRFTRSRPKSSKRFYIEYEFDTGSGERQSRNHMVTANEFPDLKVGDRISVIYDPNDTGHNRPVAFLVRKGVLDN